MASASACGVPSPHPSPPLRPVCPQVMVNCSNGFAVAECDLELRGAGEVLGKRQSGRDVKTTFKVCAPPLDVVAASIQPRAGRFCTVCAGD